MRAALLVGTILLLVGCVSGVHPDPDHQQTARPSDLNDLEQLGKKLYFDTALSEPAGQSCATCHDQSVGWTGPKTEINQGGAVYPGAAHERFGNRKPPSAAYATPSPPLRYDAEEEMFIGGNFWDGRATGWLLGEPAAEQAQGPFLNPAEQNLPDVATLVARVCASAYGDHFRFIYGTAICDRIPEAYNAIGQAIYAYENSPELNAFSSKYDHYLRDPARYPLSAQELYGLQLFNNEEKGKCAECHPSAPGKDGSPPLFTDFSYDNLGLPKNRANPTYHMPVTLNPQGAAWVDPGLGGFLATVPRFAHLAGKNNGLHKVPTLRNVDKRPYPDFVKAFGHNGVFKSLKEIVHFYNTRDTLPECETVSNAAPGVNCWSRPEVADNLNKEELGNLKLSEAEELAIVVFLQTLNDGWAPTAR